MEKRALVELSEMIGHQERGEQAMQVLAHVDHALKGEKSVSHIALSPADYELVGKVFGMLNGGYVLYGYPVFQDDALDEGVIKLQCSGCHQGGIEPPS